MLTQVFFAATVAPTKQSKGDFKIKKHPTSSHKDDLDFHFRPGTALDGEHQIESFIYHSQLLQCLIEPRLLTHQGGHVAQGLLKLFLFCVFAWGFNQFLPCKNSGENQLWIQIPSTCTKFTSFHLVGIFHISSQLMYINVIHTSLR